MDGIVALLLSKKFTKDTVIGMGAIKGAPCQVQSINKVNKTTTITLKWEDNVGGSHTQAFDIEDGADGVSVTNANINANGNLIITLSNGNDIDCGKVLPQYDTLPSATSSNVGQILQYIGATNANYTHGYYYECVNDGGVYKWQYINVQDSYTKEQIGSLSDLPDITKNVILNIADLSSAIDDKEDIFRYSSLPSPTSTNVGEIAQYIGTTTVNYINGYYYQCVESPVGSGTYIWVQKNVQPNNGGGGGDGVVDGYYNSTDQLFYEDSAFLNPITGEDNTIYVDLNTNGLYRYDGAIFIKVSSSAESIQVDTMPTASAEELDKIYQFIGTTGTYTNGYFYKCVYDSQTTTYNWEEVRTQDSYLKNETYSKDEIGDLTNLPDNTKDIVENIIDLDENKENIFRYAHGADIPTASVDNVGTIIQYIGTTTSDYNSGFFYQSQLDSETSTYKWVNIEVQPASGTSAVESVNNKTGVVVLDAKDIGLQVETMPTPNVDTLGDIVQYVGTTTENYTNGRFYKCVYDGVSVYSWVVAEDYISKSGTVGLVKNDGSIDQSQYAKEADLAQEFSTATNYVIGDYVTYLGNFYKFTSNHNAGAWDANDVTSVDVITLLGNKADKVNSATNGDLASFDASGNLTDSNIAATNVVVKSNTVGLIKNDGDIDTNTYATTTQLNDKADKVTSATANDFATLDASGNLTDSGISKDIVPSNAATNNKLVTANDISTLSDKANKVTSATNGDIATLDSNGDLADSGFSKDIIPSTATTSNKLATNADLPTELNDLSDDVVITNPQNNQIFAYNGTSGKWENKTGQETIGGLVFKGSILFANLPTTGMTNGDAYDIKDAFTTDSRFEEGAGIECGAGTDVVWVADENKWNILTPSGVYSFNGRTGAILPTTSDYDADQIDYDNTTSGLTATDVQDAIDELQSEKADASNVPTAYTSDPEMDGTASAGSSSYWAKGDHVHPTDTSRASASDLTSHINNTNNPHSVTATQVGLGSVVNTGDSDTPVSGGTTKFTTGGAYTELNKKADKVTSGSTNGHLAGLDSNGNLTDSGVVANDVIQKASVATGLLKNDGTVDNTTYAPSANAYLVGDTAETTIDDADYFPFYDTSATGKRKTLFSSIVNKLKNTFATLVIGTFTSGNFVSLDSSGNIADSGKKASDFVGTSDIYKKIKVNNTGAGGSTPKYIKIENAYPTSLVNALVYNISAGYGDSEILTLSTKDDNTRQTPVLNLITRTNVARLSGLKYDTNGDIYIGISAYTTATVTQIAGTTIANFSVSLINAGDLPSTVTDGIIINSVNKIDKVSSATQNDIAIFDANGGVADSNVLISSLPTISPTPSSNPTESDIVDAVNLASSNSANAPSLYGVQQWTNEKKVRRVLNGANIPSGVTANATGIGTWDDTEPPTETDWWYDAAFVVPVYYKPTTDTVIVTGKTYYTQSGTAPNYTYTAVTNPVVADIGNYYEQYSDDVEISIKFDPSGDTTVLGGYILDTTTGKICIKFANSIDITKARIAVDLTYTRNEVS